MPPTSPARSSRLGAAPPLPSPDALAKPDDAFRDGGGSGPIHTVGLSATI